jgi:hypothetical protein
MTYFGDEGLLARSRKRLGPLLMLVAKLTVTEGPWAGQSFRHWFNYEVVEDALSDLSPLEIEGQRKAAEIGYHMLLRVLDSAHGISSQDHSETAEKAREIPNLQSFGDLEFWAVVDSRYTADGKFQNNYVKRVLRPGDDDYPTPEEMDMRRGKPQPWMQPRRDPDDEIPF